MADILLKLNGSEVGSFNNGIFKDTKSWNLSVATFEAVNKKSFVETVKNLKKDFVEGLKKTSTFLFGIAMSMMYSGYGNKAFAAEPVVMNVAAKSATNVSLWERMLPLFNIFQDIAMVVGTLAIFAGLIVMIFKKSSGKKFVLSTAVVIGAVFLVPAAIMLVAIIGGMLNDVLIEAFNGMNIRDSVEVGGK